MAETKRKTTTSSSVKQRYNEAHYTTIRVSVAKKTAEAYKQKCDGLGIPYSKILHEAIEKFLENSEK